MVLPFSYGFSYGFVTLTISGLSGRLQGIIHVRGGEAAEALQEGFPMRGQAPASGDVLSAPVVQGCLLRAVGPQFVS